MGGYLKRGANEDFRYQLRGMGCSLQSILSVILYTRNENGCANATHNYGSEPVTRHKTESPSPGYQHRTNYSTH